MIRSPKLSAESNGEREHDDVGEEHQLVVAVLRVVLDGRLDPRLAQPVGRHVDGHAVVDDDHRGVARDADEHDRHATQQEVAGAEREDQHVRRDEQAETQVVPARLRDRQELERELEAETAEEQRAPAPVRHDESRVGAAGHERQHEGDRHGDPEHQHPHARYSGYGHQMADTPYDPARCTKKFSSSVGNGVARITINRPERRNAMSYGVMAGLREAMAAARADDDGPSGRAHGRGRPGVLRGRRPRRHRRERRCGERARRPRAPRRPVPRHVVARQADRRARRRATRSPAVSGSRARATSSSRPTTRCSGRRRSTSACGRT